MIYRFYHTLPFARARHTTSVVNGTIYAIGGSAMFPPTDSYTSVEAFTPDGEGAVASQDESIITWGDVKEERLD